MNLLRELLTGQPVGALGTIHQGRAFVSMVPFAILEHDGAPIPMLHVSRLAAHTKDMLNSPAVSLMVMASQQPGTMAQATARLTIQAQALPLAAPAAGEPHRWHADARMAYLERFPDSEPLFGFGDFSLFALVPDWVRVVAGFGQATTVLAADLPRAWSGA